jgi:uncharacterized integral membrane protein (TIGR00698 family)
MSETPSPAAASKTLTGGSIAESSITAGVALCAGIALCAFALRLIPGVATLSPLILSIMLGIVFQNLVGTPAAARAGVGFAMRRILRLGVMLLGFQLTLMQIVDVGLTGVAIIMVCLIGCFFFTIAAGRLIGVEAKLAELIAAGTSICGASAVIATNIVTEAPDEDVAYAVVCVTMFGTIAMFVYPLLPGLLHLAPRSYGLWTGASVHEVAQVVAAAYQDGKVAGDYGTIAKLTRVIMLVPMVLGLGAMASGNHHHTTMRKSIPIPYFILGFLAAMIVNSMFVIPPLPKTVLVTAAAFLSSVALAALGLATDFAKLRAKGTKPLMLCGAATLFIAGLSLVLVEITRS